MTSRTAGRRNASCAGALLNIISLLIVIVILLVVAGVVAALAQPDLVAPVTALLGRGPGGEEPVPTPTMAVAAELPTLTHTPPAPDLAPTWTPQSPHATVEPTATNTRSPRETPTITPTFPPPTNTPTETPTPTPTETPGPSPTPTNTRAPYQFTKDEMSPVYLRNHANTAECNWLGIAGDVRDLQGNPVPTGQYRVHVWGSGINERVPVGGAPAYSESGYEQFVFDAPVIRDYNIQLETSNGSVVSQVYAVQTRASCNQNLLIFNFVQNH